MVKTKYLVGKSPRQSLSMEENDSIILIVEIGYDYAIPFVLSNIPKER